MRIAIDARSLLCAQPRGEGKSLLRLYEQIATQRPDIELVFFGDAAAAHYVGPLPAGTKVVTFPALGDRWNAWENVFLPLGARRLRCNLIHCTSSGAPWRAALPVVMTVHDLIPLLFNDGHDARARQLFSRRLRRGLEQAEHVIAVSESTRRDLLRVFPAFAGPVDVVHWGADGHAQSAERPRHSPPTILVFGGEAHRKNTDYALERFINAAQRVPDLQLQIVGIASARQRASLLARVDAAGMTSRVTMPGFVSEDALASLIDQATALLYPSLYEGFGLPVLEAIGRGLAVLASDKTSIPEVLAGAPGCFSLEEPRAIEDALVRLSTDDDARRCFVAAQSRVLSRFSWVDVAAATISILESAVAKPRRKRTPIGICLLSPEPRRHTGAAKSG